MRDITTAGRAPANNHHFEIKLTVRNANDTNSVCPADPFLPCFCTKRLNANPNGHQSDQSDRHDKTTECLQRCGKYTDGNAVRVRVWGKADEYLCKCTSLSLRGGGTRLRGVDV